MGDYETDGPLTLDEMESAFNELHDCMIRRSSDVCEVRKEWLVTALEALDLTINVRKRLDGIAY